MRAFATAFLTLGLAATAFAADNELSATEKQEGWKLLFDGTATTGWANRDKDTLTSWEAKDGALSCKGGGDAVYKAEQFENFVLSLDWKIADKGNSGVFIRLSSEKDWINTGMEVQVLDLNEAGEMSRPSHVAGALYDVVIPDPAAPRMKPGEWNHFDITCDGPKISCKMNGAQTFAIDVSEEKWQKPQGKFKLPYGTLPRKGWIMLQDHHSPVQFKNIKLKVLDAAK
jgi:hypothetical protein